MKMPNLCRIRLYHTERFESFSRERDRFVFETSTSHRRCFHRCLPSSPSSSIGTIPTAGVVVADDEDKDDAALQQLQRPILIIDASTSWLIDKQSV
jgi:hypothetical protein